MSDTKKLLLSIEDFMKLYETTNHREELWDKAGELAASRMPSDGYLVTLAEEYMKERGINFGSREANDTAIEMFVAGAKIKI